MAQYNDIFIENGFEEMEILREITPELLTQMKIPPGHQIKLMKALKQENPREISSCSIPKRTDLIELPEPEKKDSAVGGMDPVFEEKVEKDKEKTVLNEKNQSMLNHSNSFQRGIKPKINKTVSFKEIKTNTFENHKDEGTGTSPKASSTTTSKISCWNCFKLFEKENFDKYERNFCTEVCLKTFLSINELSCKNCQKKVLKSQGIFRNNEFFCNEQCAPQIEDLYKLWSKEIKETEEPKELLIKQENFKKENLDLDLFLDLKTLGNKQKDTVFLSMKEIEEKYKDFNEKNNFNLK